MLVTQRLDKSSRSRRVMFSSVIEQIVVSARLDGSFAHWLAYPPPRGTPTMR